MSTSISEIISKRFRESFDSVNISFAEAARRIGEKSPTRLRDIYHGRQRCPIEVLVQLADLGIDYNYVMTGNNSSTDTEHKSSAREVADPLLTRQAATSIPLYDLEAAAGDGKDVLDESESRVFSIDEEILTPRGIKPEQCVMLSISGDSMLPTLSDGDVVVVDRTRDMLDDGIFLFEMDGRLRVKRLQRVAGGAYVLISDNEKYQAVIVPPNELNTLRIIGRCVFKVGAIS